MALAAGYQAIKAESKRIGQPRLWREDLTKLDRLTIAKHPEEAFLWGVRSTGTDLHLMEQHNNRPSLEWLKVVVKNGRNAWYYWNGERLQQLSRDAYQFALDWYQRHGMKAQRY